MNTIGKILVICNLLVALATGGFLVVDFATRTNWKQGFEQIKRELVVRDANYKTMQETNLKLNTEARQARSDKEKVLEDLKMADKVHEAQISNHKIELEESSLRTKEAELNNQRTLAEIDRLKEEVKGLLTTLQKREKVIIALEEDNKTETSAISAQTEAATMHERNVLLVDKVRQLEEIAAQRTNTNVTETNIIRDPNQPNPPPTLVKGVIEKVDDKDRTLVQLSVGTDHGVKKNHTLEVYRTLPRAEYLGMVRIIDSYQHKSVGKLMRNNLPRPPLQQGDTVASSIGNQ